MTTAIEIAVLVNSIMLFIFLVALIILIIKLMKLIKSIRRIAHELESFISMIKNIKSTIMAIKQGLKAGVGHFIQKLMGRN